MQLNMYRLQLVITETTIFFICFTLSLTIIREHIYLCVSHKVKFMQDTSHIELSMQAKIIIYIYSCKDIGILRFAIKLFT